MTFADLLYSSEIDKPASGGEPPPVTAADPVPELDPSCLAVPKVAGDVDQEDPSQVKAVVTTDGLPPP